MRESPRPPVRSDADEFERRIDKLTKINNALMQRVERSMDQQANAFSLFQTAIGLEKQIRARTEELKSALSKLEKANEELKAARDAAERANRSKTRLFTAVGHDLLQPLHAARLSLGELADAQQQLPNQRLAASVSTSLTAIEDLLTSILDLSKLEAGVFTPVVQPIALGALFEQLCTGLQPIARRKDLWLSCRPAPQTVLSDPLMLRRILQNLLANAINYTHKGGLLLAARTRGDRVRIEVWDTGPGISPQERERIFDEFQRGVASERSGGTGFGLGLSIVKRMSEALQHPLDLCTRVGHGTRFALSVPLTDVTAITAPAPKAGFEKASAASYGRMEVPVIVIDNDLAVLEAMQSLLMRWGADVRLARDFDDIGDIMGKGQFQPAIVLADYHLDDGVSGLDAVKRIRILQNEDVPAILITADRTDETTQAARKNGCELLHKPVKPAELRALMQHLLK
ncbi:MAG TPA: hybrid sensor histidine kinase/response regulator [Hyphomicrobium sp.]|nr:hybrid sensor histidine kinase/response regulator [Hyphomicrobium sp.]